MPCERLCSPRRLRARDHRNGLCFPFRQPQNRRHGADLGFGSRMRSRPCNPGRSRPSNLWKLPTPWKRRRERPFLLRQRRPSSPWDLASVESGLLSSPAFRLRFRGPEGKVRSLWRPHPPSFESCSRDRRRIIGVDRLYPPVAKALFARVETACDGIRGHRRRAGHRPLDGMEHLSCFARHGSPHYGNPMRQRPGRDPVFRLPSLRGIPFWPAGSLHPRPRVGPSAFCRIGLNLPGVPMGNRGDRRAIDARFK